MHKVTAILNPHSFIYKDQWLVLLNALISFNYSRICSNFFYHLRGITFISDTLFHGVGYILNFTVKVQNALVKKAVVITAGHVNGVLLV